MLVSGSVGVPLESENSCVIGGPPGGAEVVGVEGEKVEVELLR